MAEPISAVAAICGAVVGVCATARYVMRYYYRWVKDDEVKRREERDRVIGLLKNMENCLKRALSEMRQGNKHLSGLCGQIGVHANALQDPKTALWVKGEKASTRMISDLADYWNRAFDIEYIAQTLPEESPEREDLLQQLEEATGQIEATIRQIEAMR